MTPRTTNKGKKQIVNKQKRKGKKQIKKKQTLPLSEKRLDLVES